MFPAEKVATVVPDAPAALTAYLDDLRYGRLVEVQCMLVAFSELNRPDLTRRVSPHIAAQPHNSSVLPETCRPSVFESSASWLRLPGKSKRGISIGVHATGNEAALAKTVPPVSIPRCCFDNECARSNTQVSTAHLAKTCFQWTVPKSTCRVLDL